MMQRPTRNWTAQIIISPLFWKILLAKKQMRFGEKKNFLAGFFSEHIWSLHPFK